MIEFFKDENNKSIRNHKNYTKLSATLKLYAYFVLIATALNSVTLHNTRFF